MGKMRKTKNSRAIIIAFLIIILAAAGLFIWETAEIRQYAGTYADVDAEDSAYELHLSKTGRISVADIGAGNPAIEGWIYRIPFSAEHSKYKLVASGETDDIFLDIGNNRGDTWVWLSTLGQFGDDEKHAAFRTVIIENKSDHMQFNEEG